MGMRTRSGVRPGRDGFRDIRVLVVDDEQFSRSLIRQGLLNQGFGTVDVAADVKQASAMLFNAEQRYDAIVSDYRMPELTGIDLLRRIRAGARGVSRDIVFGILTGYTEKEVVGLAFNLDADFFISKPLTMDGLVSRLTKSLSTSRPVKPPKFYATVGLDPAPPAPAPAGTSEDPGAGPDESVGTAAVETGAAVTLSAKVTAPASVDPVLAGGVKRSISQVTPGAVLAGDIRTSAGTLILQSGFTLTGAIIDRLRNLSEIDPAVRDINVMDVSPKGAIGDGPGDDRPDQGPAGDG